MYIQALFFQKKSKLDVSNHQSNKNGWIICNFWALENMLQNWWWKNDDDVNKWWVTDDVIYGWLLGAIFSLYLSSLQKSSPIAVAGHKKVILSTLYYGILCCIHTYGASRTIVEFEIACFFIKILKKCNSGRLSHIEILCCYIWSFGNTPKV